MNDIEIVQLPNGIEGFISELKQATAVKWDYEKGKYEIDTSPKIIEKQQAGFEKFKTAVREVYTFGETVARGTSKFCLALLNIYNGLKYVENSDAEDVCGLNVKPSLGYSAVLENFKRFVCRLGLSSTSAYRYKDLGNFVDETTNDFYSEFKVYSLSVLSEIWTYAVDYRLTDLDKLKSLCEIIPSETTVEEMRVYRKAVKELMCYCSGALFEDYTYKQRAELRQKPVPEVIEVYNGLIEERERAKLTDVLQTSNTPEKKKVAKTDDNTEINALKKELEILRPKAARAAIIGQCKGCKFKDVNLNKCRCCRRYESLKDLFEKQ